MFMFGGASADHKEEDTLQPIKSCFDHVRVYKQMAVNRQAGLTLDETLEANGYTMRVVKFITEQQGLSMDDVYESLESIELKAGVIYAISAEDFASDEYMNKWATDTFNTCVTEIPNFSLTPDASAVEANDRMLPAE